MTRLNSQSSREGATRAVLSGGGRLRGAPSDRCSFRAKVAELADALDLGSSGVSRGGSSPPFRTIPALA